MTRPGAPNSKLAEVTYNPRAFKRGFQSGQQPLQLETLDGDGTSLTALQGVLADCRPNWNALAVTDRSPLWISDPVAAPNGPLCRLQATGARGPIETLLDDIATGLTARGISGSLRPAATKLHPVFKGGTDGYFTTLSASLTLPVDLEQLYSNTDPYGRPHYDWLVDPELTREVLKTAIEWCLDVEGDTYISGVIQTTLVAAPADDIVGFLLDAPPAPEALSYMFGVKRATRHRMRYVGTDRYGLLTLQEVDNRTDQHSALSELMAITDALAPYTWTTSVRESATGLTGWEFQPTHQNHRSPIDATGGTTDWWRVLHLLPDYVLDAHVHQVLTDSQLAKTHLPDERWTVTALGSGRHSVSAADPEPWLDHSDHTQRISADNRPTGVDPAVLDQARRDFGEAILTPRTLELHPPPMPNDLYETYLSYQPDGE